MCSSDLVKNCSRLCKETGTRDWISWVARGLQAARMLHTCQACQKLKSRTSYCIIGQKSQASQAICSRLELVTQPSRKVKLLEHPVWENLTFTFLLTLLYIYPYTHDLERASRENFERENKIDSSTIFI